MDTQNEYPVRRFTVVDTLEEFRKTTKKKGWNGYDAEPLSDRVIDNAIALVKTLSSPPEVFPVATGNIQMEWDRSDGGYLEVTVGEDPDKVDLYLEIPKQNFTKHTQMSTSGISVITSQFKRGRMADM